MPETTGALLTRLESVLREQDGYVTTHQAARLGVRQPKLHALLKAGDLRRILRSVYVLDRLAPLARVEERTFAAWLALDGRRLPWERKSPVVVASHASAARIHQLGTLPADTVELTSDGRRTTMLPAIRVHVAPLDPQDWEWAADRRIMVTTPARTIVDLALSSAERDYVRDAFDEAVDRRLASLQGVTDAAERRSPRRVADIQRLLGA